MNLHLFFYTQIDRIYINVKKILNLPIYEYLLKNQYYISECCNSKKNIALFFLKFFQQLFYLQFLPKLLHNPLRNF